MKLLPPEFDDYARGLAHGLAERTGEAIRARTGSGGFSIDDGVLTLGSELAEQEYGGDPFLFDSIMDVGARP